MVSIKDIAKKAGVSISTVSYALNGSPKVTEETSAKILAIAKELNYIPNAAARTLKKRKTKIIGAFLTDYSGPFFGQLLHGMRETLNSKNYDLVVCTGEESHRFLPEGIIDGAIVLDATFPDEELISYADRGHKLVVLDREIDNPNIERVLLDNKMGAELAVNFLLKNGHNKIVFVTGSPGSYDSEQRLHYVQELMENHPSISYQIIHGDFDKPSGERAAQQIIQNYTDPVAVFCFNDEMAIGMYNYLSGTDFVIGEHIHIIGFDDIEVSQFVHPRLSTIHYSKKDWGSKAAEQLIKLIKKEKTKSHQITVELIVGGSVGKLK
ncbi:LacI family DNA-binding transcriptional regulator [Lederbergia wuyishanensis]|uniref:LacI family transcriptional regulator n=1 Tax=Lederbergia wuyishanensis TaxID=1347903 RepID=A0ABU0D3Y8_9BACI|nr:LacI family DNA-binding transcriptional regulator [Lederbergia wuyishanensis]MCJ8007715.1 LacI family transcriptional regulator [Lederbergia wuyishanensis]MDQ0343122.1 LacI family transcriptional regulator [Lederbergia wuyishanensis]